MFAGSTNYQFWVTLYGIEGISSFMQRGMVSKIIRGIRWVIVQLLLLPVYFYRAAISPLTSASCRHVPTCSQYAIDAVKIHGPIKGFFMATNRILHCHPWGTSGYDPVPPKK